MTFNISRFTENIGLYGLQSVNKFEVDISVPKFLKDGLITGPANDVIATFISPTKVTDTRLFFLSHNNWDVGH